MRKRKISLMKAYFQEHKSCEKCGRYIGCEVHHKIPFSQGGKDEFNNYITLCADCHNRIHIIDKSALTKEGLEKAKNKFYYKTILVADLMWLVQQKAKNDSVSACDVLDIAEFECPNVKHIEESKLKGREWFNEIQGSNFKEE